MEKSELMRDIEAAKEIIEHGRDFSGTGYDAYFQHYDLIYPFNNEDIKEYYDYFDYSNGVLTVASSGDHMLHAILKGATDILLFDINKLTSYYCALKLAAAKTLTHKEFFDFFGRKDDMAPNFNNRELCERIITQLEEDDKNFWGALYKDGFLNVRNTKNLFNLVSSPKDNAFYDKEEYNILQKNAKHIAKPSFICCDALELSKHIEDKMFSTIFLSNIGGYMTGPKYKKFQRLIYDDLDKHLTPGGLIAFSQLPSSNENIERNQKKCGSVYAYKK